LLLLTPVREIGAKPETIMGNVIVSPNIKKQSDRIDPAGNIINPKTRQVIQPVEPEYVPPAVPITAEVKKETPNMSEKINKMVEAKIAEKIDAIVEQRVADALKNL
jgi:hypothetical protein